MESYNIKVIEYINGTTEIREYSKPIRERPKLTKDWKKRVEEDIITSKFAEQLSLKFDEEEKNNTKANSSELSAEELEARQVKSVKNSLSRTKQALYSIARQCKWDYFITLTFDGSKVDRYSFDICMKKANTWFGNQRKRYAEELQYLFVPEQHKDGAWHIHGLIAQCGAIKFVDSGRNIGGKVIYNLDGWNYGFSTATKIEDSKRVSAYITKYITKEVCAVTKGKKRYYRSQNIPEPIESTYLLNYEESKDFIKILADSLGLDVSYVKQIQGEYMDVKYTYLDAIEESEEKENE